MQVPAKLDMTAHNYLQTSNPSLPGSVYYQTPPALGIKPDIDLHKLKLRREEDKIAVLIFFVQFTNLNKLNSFKDTFPMVHWTLQVLSKFDMSRLCLENVN